MKNSEMSGIKLLTLSILVAVGTFVVGYVLAYAPDYAVEVVVAFVSIIAREVLIQHWQNTQEPEPATNQNSVIIKLVNVGTIVLQVCLAISVIYKWLSN